MEKISVKKGDTVVVIAGKDKGKQGKVIASFPSKQRISVQGVNIVARHTKPKSAQDKGGIIKKEGTIDASNVMVLCPACGKATRVKHTVVDGKSVRVCKCGKVLDKKYVKETKKTIKAEAKAEAKAKTKAEVEEKKDAPATKKVVKKEVATAANTKVARVAAKVKRDV